MTSSVLLQRGSRWLLVHLLHAVILLLPTIVLTGSWPLETSTICFAIGIGVAAILESVIVSRYAIGASHSVQDRVAMRVASLVGLSMLATFWIAQIERQLTHIESWAVHVLGAILLALGVGLRVVAIQALGPRFISDIRVEGAIVREGIYAWVRHPSEVGLLLIVAGGPLLLGSPITATAATVFLMPFSGWRMYRENIAMASARR